MKERTEGYLVKSAFSPARWQALRMRFAAGSKTESMQVAKKERDRDEMAA